MQNVSVHQSVNIIICKRSYWTSIQQVDVVLPLKPGAMPLQLLRMQQKNWQLYN